MGLFTFVAPKQAKAAPPKYPYTAEICCDDGNCYYCLCQHEGDEEIWKSIMCPSTGGPGDTPSD